MKHFIFIFIFLWGFCFSIPGIGINTAWAKKTGIKKGTNEKLLNRIDFGSSHVMGQTIKSGAVYLMQRKKSEIKSMLKYREDYREEILEDFKIQDGK